MLDNLFSLAWELDDSEAYRVTCVVTKYGAIELQIDHIVDGKSVRYDDWYIQPCKVLEAYRVLLGETTWDGAIAVLYICYKPMPGDNE